MATQAIPMQNSLPAPRLPIGKLAICAVIVVMVAVCLHAALRHPDTAQKVHDCFEQTPQNIVLHTWDIQHGSRVSYCQLGPDLFGMCAFDIDGSEKTCYMSKYRSISEILRATKDRAFQIVWDSVKGWIPAGGG